MQLIKLNKPLSMTSLEIANITGKNHSHVLRDIRNMFKKLGNPFLDDAEVIRQIDNSGRTIEYILNERFTLLLVSGYSVLLRDAIIKQWQAMRDALDVLRYRKNDTLAQIDAMAVIGYMLPEEERKEKLPYIKANSTVNKIASDIHGFPKMLKKDEMNLPMLETRTSLLDKYAKLFDMGFDNHLINEMLRKQMKLLN